MKNSYLFIRTDSKEIQNSANDLLKKSLNKKTLQESESHCTYVFESEKDSTKPCFSFSINNIKNYSIKELQSDIFDNKLSNSINTHTLSSIAYYDDTNFYCKIDFLGVSTHYYYNKDQTTIISDNLFLIANLVNADYSKNGIFDAILFKQPFGKNTWFQDIYCLEPGNLLQINYLTNNLSITGKTCFENFLLKNNLDITNVYLDFFKATSLSDSNKVLSLSAGSDSRSVLAGLMHSRKNFKSYSWGGSQYLETLKIKKLVKKYNLNWDIIEFDSLKNNYQDYLKYEFFISNSLVPSEHIFYFHSHLPDNSMLFEGYGGSELVKGELSDGMYTPLHKMIIKDNYTLKEALNILYKESDQKTLTDIHDYFLSNYKPYLENINTDKGKNAFQLYLLNFLPSKVFGGIIKPLAYLNHKLMYPYFSPYFLASIFGQGMGIVENISLRNDFAGPIQSIKPQSIILKNIKSVLYTSKLDRNVRYSEWNYPNFIISNIRKFRQQFDKIKKFKNPITAQVNYAYIKKDVEFEKNSDEYPEFFNKLKSGSSESNLNRISTSISIMNEIKGTDKIQKYISKIND